MPRFSLGGWTVDPSDGPLISPITGSVPAGSANIGGAAFTQTGRRYCKYIAGSVPTPAYSIGGLAHSADGALYITNTAPSPGYQVGQFKCTADGAVYINPRATVVAFNGGLPMASDGGLVARTADTDIIWDFDAEEQSLSPIIGAGTLTCTRSGVATRVNSSGWVETVAADQPRWDYDPLTLEFAGYLREVSRTNLLLRSDDFGHAAWGKTDITVLSDHATSPSGTGDADLLTEGSAGTALLAQDYTATANFFQSPSFFIKPRDNVTWVRLLVFEAAATTNRCTAWFNVQTGAVGSVTVGGTGSAAFGRIKRYIAGGYYRIMLTGSVGNGATALRVAFSSAAADGSSTPVAGASYWLWGAQAENGTSGNGWPSTYIPTAGATVNRGAETLSTATAGITGFDATKVSVLCHAELDAAANSPAIFYFPWSLSDGTANQDLTCYCRSDDISSAGTGFHPKIVTGGVAQAEFSCSGTLSRATTFKCMIAAAANDSAGTFNGGTVNTDATLTMPTMSQLDVGKAQEGQHWHGHIKKLRILKVRVNNGNMQVLAA